ncbi:ABC transporter permease subunit [soil metagenome]
MRPRSLGLAALLGGLLLPLLPILVWAVSGQWRYPALVPTELSMRALALLGSSGSGFFEALRNSAVIATTVAVVAGGIGLSAGRALGLYDFRGKRAVQFAMLAPVIVPGLAVTLGIHVLFIRYGLTNTIAGIVLVHLIPTIPYVTLVMSSVYANYDIAYEQQARVLGARPSQVLRHVTLPRVFPGLAVAMLFAFLISWSEYILTLLIGGGRVRTLPILLFSFLGGSDTAVIAALSLAFIGPSLVLLVVTSRYLSGSDAMAGFGRL